MGILGRNRRARSSRMRKKGGWSSHGAAWIEGRREMKLPVRKLLLARHLGP